MGYISNKYNKYLIVFAMILFLSLLLVSNVEKYNPLYYDLRNILINGDHISNDIKEEIELNINNEMLTKSDEYFYRGYLALLEDKDKSKELFKLSIEYIENSTNFLTKIYANKYLSDIYIDEGNKEDAVYHIDEAFRYIDKKRYNEEHYIITDIYENIVVLNEGQELVRGHLSEIQGMTSKMSIELESGVKRQEIILNILENDLLDIIQIYLEMLNTLQGVKDNYYLLMTTVDIAILSKQVGSLEMSRDILMGLEDKSVEDLRRNAELQVYRLMTLAQVENHLGLHNKALSLLDEIGKYKKYFSSRQVENIEKSINIITASIYTEKGNTRQAKTYIEKVECSENSKRLNEVFIKSNYDLVKADIYYKEGNVEKATEGYKNIIELKDNYKSYNYRQASIKLLEISYNNGNLEELFKHYEMVFRLNDSNEINLSQLSYKYIENTEEYYEMQLRHDEITKIAFVLVVIIGIISWILAKQNIYPSIKKRNTQNKVRLNLLNENYKLHYQPIVDPEKSEIVGLEALIRLEQDGKLIYPLDILKELEYCNMLDELSIWILKELVRDYRRFKKMKNVSEDFYLSMNVSLEEIESEKVFNKFKQIMTRSLLPKGSICLEITENKKANDTIKTRKNIEELIECGFIIGIDDFGVDYANISSLEDFTHHIIKLDKYFIDNLEESVVVRSTISAIDKLVQMRGISVVLEGVETLEQKELVKEIVSSKFYLQGYYYSKPVEIHKIESISI